MAQATRSKDVRKNCIDVEKVILECFQETERNEIGENIEPMKIEKPRDEFSKSKKHINSLNSKGLLYIDQVKQNLVFKNYAVY
ncbi:MAG: hypothetical protein R3255_09800 [Candidatus Lokiarchaeia archaeon]|nr:hypothetical protein [Candidatus Lokiarchaeia archaeon]